MSNFTWGQLCLDASYNGQLAGQHLEQARWDMEAADAWHAIKISLGGDRLPEEVAVSWFNAKYTNPRLNSFLTKEPFVPFDPVPGVPLVERARRQAVACFHRLTQGYTPTVLSECEETAKVRARIRLAQVANAHAVLRTAYARTLKLSTDQSNA